MWWLILYAWIYSILVPICSIVMYYNRKEEPLIRMRPQIPWIILSSNVGMLIIIVVHLWLSYPSSQVFIFLYEVLSFIGLPSFVFPYYIRVLHIVFEDQSYKLSFFNRLFAFIFVAQFIAAILNATIWKLHRDDIFLWASIIYAIIWILCSIGMTRKEGTILVRAEMYILLIIFTIFDVTFGIIRLNPDLFGVVEGVFPTDVFLSLAITIAFGISMIYPLYKTGRSATGFTYRKVNDSEALEFPKLNLSNIQSEEEEEEEEEEKNEEEENDEEDNRKTKQFKWKNTEGMNYDTLKTMENVKKKKHRRFRGLKKKKKDAKFRGF